MAGTRSRVPMALLKNEIILFSTSYNASKHLYLIIYIYISLVYLSPSVGFGRPWSFVSSWFFMYLFVKGLKGRFATIWRTAHHVPAAVEPGMTRRVQGSLQHLDLDLPNRSSTVAGTVGIVGIVGCHWLVCNVIWHCYGNIWQPSYKHTHLWYKVPRIQHMDQLHRRVQHRRNFVGNIEISFLNPVSLWHWDHRWP